MKVGSPIFLQRGMFNAKFALCAHMLHPCPGTAIARKDSGHGRPGALRGWCYLLLSLPGSLQK